MVIMQLIVGASALSDEFFASRHFCISGYRSVHGKLAAYAASTSIREVNEPELICVQVSSGVLGVDSFALEWIKAFKGERDCLQVRQVMSAALWVICEMAHDGTAKPQHVSEMRRHTLGRGLGLMPDHRPTASDIPSYIEARETGVFPAPQWVGWKAKRMASFEGLEGLEDWF